MTINIANPQEDEAALREALSNILAPLSVEIVSTGTWVNIQKI